MKAPLVKAPLETLAQSLTITTPTCSYPVHFGQIGQIETPHKVLLVSNPTISSLYLPQILKSLKASEVHTHLVRDGEEFKDMASIEGILESAFTHRLDRKSLFIALGGGVIGDMVGFASGIFQRGVEFIQIPTTLLSQVDASVGGKCGINNAFGKNLIGLFHQPKAVYINPAFLASLPPREFSAGVAEIIKMAVCFDRAFFEFLEAHHLGLDSEISESTKPSISESSPESASKSTSESALQNLHYAIRKSIEIKAQVVSDDERERGIRAALNYGHTFGHVIENLTHYRTYLHGEAVSMGINMANALALKLGLLTEAQKARIEGLLLRYHLPTSFKVECANAFYEQFFLDKKSAVSKIMFILPEGIGGVRLCDDVPKSAVLEVLESFR